jgi:xylan 1,4-beta-xylosidase
VTRTAADRGAAPRGPAALFGVFTVCAASCLTPSGQERAQNAANGVRPQSSLGTSTGAGMSSSDAAVPDGGAAVLPAVAAQVDAKLRKAQDLVCSDPAPWSPEPPPGPCGDSPPWTRASAKAVVHLRVDAGAPGRPWSRFYEKAVAADHANTLRCTVWGRNAQNALRKAHSQAGFEYVRFHGVLNDDIGVYTQDAAGNPTYEWSRLDQVYDAITSAGMRPIVEISFTPSALASQPGKVQPLLWYGGLSPNVSPPDWSRWKLLMAALVRHLEQRYGADEVRDHWYFEVWNEPSWMYSLGDAGYVELYANTTTGLLAGDPRVKVGGPAGSSGEAPTLVPALIAAANAQHLKLDFLTYHRYGDDNGLKADANVMWTFHQGLARLAAANHFTGEIYNDEFGPSSRADVCRDTEVAASFIAKTIHLIGADPGVDPPAAYGYWTVSDLYEEFDTGPALAYREGNYGLLLKGDPRYPESFDVAKPAFNAFRLLHAMGDTLLPTSGGTTDDGVGAAATASSDRKALEILVYHHVNGAQADSSQSSLVSLTVDNLAFSAGSVRVRQYVVDRTHANSHTAWVAMGKPPQPTQAQWVTLRDSAKLCYYEARVETHGRSVELTFPQNVYSASLIEVTP